MFFCLNPLNNVMPARHPPFDRIVDANGIETTMTDTYVFGAGVRTMRGNRADQDW